MATDWNRLARVKDTRRRSAQEEVARDRRAAEAGAQAAQQAQARLQAEQQAVAALWQDTASALAGGASIAALRDASGWSRTLDARVAEAARELQHARAEQALRERQLDASRRVLRAAMGEVQKVDRLRDEARATARRQSEQRLEDILDDASLQSWQRAGQKEPPR